MKNNPGGVNETVGGGRETPLQFYQQLGEERIYPVSDYLYYLKGVEKVQEFKRETAPNMELKDYLQLEENRHWGAVKYSFKQDKIEAMVYLNYSPWLNQDKDIMLEGRVILNINTKQLQNKDLYTFLLERWPCFEATFVDEELCWVEFAADRKMKVYWGPDSKYTVFDSLKAVLEEINDEI